MLPRRRDGKRLQEGPAHLNKNLKVERERIPGKGSRRCNKVGIVAERLKGCLTLGLRVRLLVTLTLDK